MAAVIFDEGYSAATVTMHLILIPSKLYVSFQLLTTMFRKQIFMKTLPRPSGCSFTRILDRKSPPMWLSTSYVHSPSF